MQLLTKSEFAKQCGKSLPAISKALKQGRLEVFQDTNKINPSSPKSQAFANTRASNQKGVSVQQPEDPTEEDKKLKLSFKELNEAQAKKIIEEAALKEQQRIEKEMKNAVRRGELVEIESINRLIMVWFDTWLNINKRSFNSSFDEFERGILNPDKSRTEIKRKWSNLFESWAHEAKEKSCEILKQIQIEQGKS